MNIPLDDYFRTLTGERSVRAIANRTGIVQSTLNRQLSGDSAIAVETVVAICRAYDLDMAEVFVAVGFITAEEARAFGASFRLEEFTDAQLLREMVRRAEDAGPESALNQPIPDEEVERVVRARDAEAHIPYIGRMSHDDIPLAAAADEKKRESDVEAADERPEPGHD